MQLLLGPTIVPWFALFFSRLVVADPTWPSAIDELEDVMYLSTGYRSRGFASSVTPCSSGVSAGRNTAAEWLRTGFHDMANANVFNAPHGGIDASLAYELNNGDNIGTGFNTAFVTYGNFFNTQLSAADLVALGVYTSVRACGGPIVPVKGGRKDATSAGPSAQIPQPQNAISLFRNQFTRMGFSNTEMIQMVACGHTLGGVHAGNFPTIVAPGTAPDDYQLFDSTVEFDNKVVTRYLAGPPLDTDPLSLGISVTNTRNSDKVVFNSDSNVTVTAMSTTDAFNSVCATILGKMIDVVDPALVTLSDVVTPYAVKPTGLQLTLLSGGTLLKFSGDIRVRTTTRSASQIVSVQLAYKDRTGLAVSAPIVAAAGGTAAGFDDTFSFYAFSTNLPVASSISSFTVTVNLVGGTSETYNNNGAEYPVDDSVIVLTPQSCYNAGNLTVVAAVRNTLTVAPTVTVTQKVKNTAGSPIASPLPNLVNATVSMVQGASSGPYNLYSASYTIASSVGTKYGVVSGSSADTFKDATDLGATCQDLGTTPPSSTSTSSTTSQTSTSTSTSASASATLSHKPIVGAYTFQGCYTEANGVRALSGSSNYDYTGMTLEKCAGLCTGFTYWGVEYGGECYCGNSLGAGSVLAALNDCSFICPGSSVQYCGAGNRLELYKLSSLVSTTSGISSTSSSSSSTRSSSSAVVSSSDTSSSSISSTTAHPSTTSSSSSSSQSLTSSTTSSSTAVPTLRIVKSAGVYNYLGCFTEANGVRALAAASFPDDTNTVEKCVAACSPYLYAGAEYGRECWCANSFGIGSAQVSDSECSMTCSGDQYEYCGAGNRLTVYIKNGTDSGSVSSPLLRTTTSTSTSISSAVSSIQTSTSPSSVRSSTSTLASSSGSSTIRSTTTTSSISSTPTVPSIKASVGNYNYYGCQTEATNIRALSGASYYNYTAMTLEMCAGNCVGWKYFGAEYGGECYCGNSFNTGSVAAPDAECSFICPGDKLEYCGAGNRLSAYVLKT
ncbi:hypothetical protein B0O99DRAFT_682314 [Bisporella sp. PMI_857]|nr:hypothetical protein B0O99DRAFT_682314 [Bisporella sp. PMI_857]